MSGRDMAMRARRDPDRRWQNRGNLLNRLRAGEPSFAR